MVGGNLRKEELWQEVEYKTKKKLGR